MPCSCIPVLAHPGRYAANATALLVVLASDAAKDTCVYSKLTHRDNCMVVFALVFCHVPLVRQTEGYLVVLNVMQRIAATTTIITSILHCEQIALFRCRYMTRGQTPNPPK